MIKLDVCEYCHGCLEFEPYVAGRPDLFHTLNGGGIAFVVIPLSNARIAENAKLFIII